MIVFGVVNAICSIIFGTIMKYTGRFVIIIFGTVVHMAIFTYLLFWRPSPDHILVFFLISGLWGVSDAVWQTQINGQFYQLVIKINFGNYF
jgi:predicted MFS family arabinose efflux permease